MDYQEHAEGEAGVRVRGRECCKGVLRKGELLGSQIVVVVATLKWVQ